MSEAETNPQASPQGPPPTYNRRTARSGHHPPGEGTTPIDLEAERAVIGAMLISDQARIAVGEAVAAEDFYSEIHRILFSTIERMTQAGEEVDQLTLADRLKSSDQFERIGGRQYMFVLIESCPTAQNVLRYASIVREKALLRNLCDAALVIHNDAQGYVEDVTEMLDAAEQKIYDISKRLGGAGLEGSGHGLMPLERISPDALSHIQDLYEIGGKIVGVSSGFPDLDRMTTGYHPGDLVVLAARPSMGKTAKALGTAFNAASKQNKAVAYFSLEMDQRQLVNRLIAQEAHVSVSAVRTGQVAREDWPRLVRAAADIAKAPLYIDDSAGTTVASIRGKLRRLDASLRAAHRTDPDGPEGVGLVVVDYLQLLIPDTARRRASDNRQQEIAEISRAMKVMARDLDVPVILLSQLSREVERRADKHPLLSDLRDSGAIEQDADMVNFLYRDEYYNDDSEDMGIAEVIIAKHRNGPTGKVYLAWIDEEARFASLADQR